MTEYREADNYLNHNSKGKDCSQDCQLVTAINAYYYLTGQIIKQNSEQYRELAELSGCKYGSCINIKKSWKKLGIWEDKRFKITNLEKYLDKECFIELNVWHKRYGYHSVAIIGYVKKTNLLRILNFKRETDIEGWISLEDIKLFIINNPDRSKPYWHGRTFKRLKIKLQERHYK